MKSKRLPSTGSKTGEMTTGLDFPDAPSYLGKLGRECWDKTVEILREMKVLDAADAKSVEAFAAAYEEYRKAREVCIDDGYTFEFFNEKGELRYAKRPEVDIMASAWQRMRSLIPELFLSPASRLKKTELKPKKAEKDPFSEFLN